MEAPSRLRSLCTLALAVLLALSGPVATGSTPAAAQGFGWFGGLFGGGQPRQPQRPAYPGYGYGYDYGSQGDAAPRRRAPRRHPVDQAVKETPKDKTPPKNAALFVDVFGDSLGQMLANGLDDAMSDRPDVAIVHKARGSTGLVASDFFDWPKTIQETLASRKDAAADPKKADGKADAAKPEKIDVAVMMIGSNDRQPIRVDGKTLATGTPEWTEAYKRRVGAIDEAFRAKGIPLVWVGVPITKDDNFADDMAALNDIYREAATRYGATYVDTWEAFSDDNGDFDAFGPDINGQTVRLRAADGVHFTKAGARKLAHFVETHVRRDLDGKGPVPQLPTDTPTANSQGDSKPKAAVAAIKPDAGPIKNLNDLPTATNGQLSAAAGDRGAGDDIVRSALLKGETQAAPKGRADDMRWPAAAAKPD